MTKKIVQAGFAFLIFCFSNVHAQGEQHCYTTEVYRERIKNHPEVLLNRDALEQSTRLYNARTASHNQQASQVYIIPIVFHIIHNYGSENISDAQVEDQVRILNDDYRKRSYDTASIVAAFKPVAADCEIEFRLAHLDPAGNCTNGIDRISSTLTYQADDDSKLNPWPNNQYLNVWVVASLAWQGAAAYAYYPGTAPLGADGVIMLDSYVGSIGTGTVSRSRVLTHEIGHSLNLEHVWGDTNNPGVSCGDDGVSDTPVTIGWTTCNLSGISCGGPVENVQNYMEYSYCCNMFTGGQKTRMRAALNSFIDGRNNLSTAANLSSTGTDGSVTALCPPVANFKTNYQTVCPGGSIQFRDLSWNGHPTIWNWSFPGGIPSSSTDSAPVVQYNSPGIFDVSLVVGNSSGSDSIGKSGYIQANGPVTQTVPYYEGFENAGSFPLSDGYVSNPDEGNTWERVTNAGSSGTSSIMINNFSGNTRGEVDEFVTPSFDFSAVTSLTMDFKVAYGFLDTLHNETLQVLVSTNCGHTWSSKYLKTGLSLATVTGVTNYFIPNASQWRQESVNVGAYHNQTNVRFKFRNISAEGNNIYIDDINLNGIVAGIHENVFSESSLHVFPNPSSGNFFIRFYLDKAEKINLNITDALGREVKKITNTQLPAGEYEYAVEKNQLDAGIYFIILEKNGEPVTRKLMISNDQ